jgi:diguanylate cyclase (GGDEF)-like protein
MEALLLWVRAAVVAINSAIFLMAVNPNTPHHGEALAIVVASTAYTVCLLVFRPYLRWPIMQTSLFTTCTDSVFISVWVLATGGPQSEFYPLYYVSVASIAIRYSLRESLTAAAAYSVGYAGLSIGTGPDPFSVVVPCLIRICYLWFIAAIVGCLAREERDRAAENTEIVQLHEELRQAQTALEYQALHDPLTGLPNRRRFDHWLAQKLSLASQEDHGVALLLLDLDGFKEVNDTMGHQAGDALLRVVADRLRGSVRACDLVARLGGDEFALALPAVSRVEAEAAARRVLAVLARPVGLDGSSIRAGGSVGIAVFPTDATGATTLVQCADRAMYIAKRNRQGYACFASSGLAAEDAAAA